MKKLLNTLYVTSEDLYLSLDGENVVAWRKDERTGRFPLHILGGIAYFGYPGASPQLLGACLERGIGFSFYRPNGRFLARIAGNDSGNILLRREQFRVSESPERSLQIARHFIIGKIHNSRQILDRARRDHPLQVDMQALEAKSKELKDYVSDAKDADSLDYLRGVEGAAARAYYAVFDQLIFANRDCFQFRGRNRRPPKDATNALLSFAYSLLANDCYSALEGVGLDPYMGFMHTDRPGRKSLALDLEEELRSVFADRVVLNCINNRVVREGHFECRLDGAVLLNDSGRKLFLDTWQAKKREVIQHPFLKEKIPWGLLPHVQALLLSRYLRGDLDGYPPFLWR